MIFTEALQIEYFLRTPHVRILVEAAGISHERMEKFSSALQYQQEVHEVIGTIGWLTSRKWEKFVRIDITFIHPIT